MDKQTKKIFLMFSRYFAVLLFGLSNLYLFYKIFTPPTIHIFYFIISIFTDANLVNNLISFGESTVEIVPACVAGAAYYLLFVLVMLTAMDVKTRAKALSASLMAFFVANIFRLLILSSLIGNINFELIHNIFWHLVSTVFVVGIWFGTVKFYNIKSVPMYTDFLYLKKSGNEKQ